MKKYKILIFGIILLILNILIKGLFLNTSPNSISLQEIDILTLLKITPHVYDFSFRIISLLIGSSISVFTYFFIFNKTKNHLLSICVSLVLCITPWLYILSRYLNLFTPLILILMLIFILIKNFKLVIFLSFAALILYLNFVLPNSFSSFIKDFSLNFSNLFAILDFRLLFFNGDPLSQMLKIPLTGFFLYVDFFAFISGMYYIYTSSTLHKDIKKIVSWLLILGLISLVSLSKDEMFATKGFILFYWISIIIGFGYYFIISNLKKNLIIFIYLFLVVIFINILFFLELFYNHFDKKYSYEWGYAEQQTVAYIIKNPHKEIYMTDESSKINRFLTFYTKKTLPIITLKNALLTCKNINTECIVREHELKIFNTEKDQIQIKFGNYAGQSVYFIISK